MLFGFSSSRKAASGFGRVVSVSLFGILALSAAPSTRARRQTGTGSSTLVSVDVTGSTRFGSDQIATAMGLRAGTSVTRDDLQRAADRLAKLGTFAGVQYNYAAVGAGVKVSFELADAPEIPLAFDNFPWFSDEDLSAALKGAVPLFDGMAPVHGTLLDEMSRAIEKLLETRNVHARVSHAIAVVGANNRQVQLFSVEGGAPDVGAIEFSDSLAKSDPTLQEHVSDLLGHPFSRSGIEVFELEQIRPLYLEHGFLQVRFGEPSVHVPSDAKGPGKAIVSVGVDPGPAYSWNGATWKGDYSIPPDALDDLLKLKTGDLADGMKIEGGIEAVRGLYGERGYLDAKIDAAPKFDQAAKRVSYSITVDEGPQYHMGNLVLTGLSLDGERRIRSAWKIPAGSVFDKNVYDQFVDTGIKQAFTGSPFRYDKIGRFLQQNPHEAKVDVMLDFQ